MRKLFNILGKRFLGLNWILQILIGLFLLIYIPTFFMWTFGLGHYSKNNQQEITEEKQLYLFVGQKIPFDKWSKYGHPITLKGTNNKYWVAYLPNINITFKSIKQNDKIIKINYGKVPNL